MKTVLIYSGGLDSTVLLYQLLAEGHDVHALSVNYGQRHGKELESAARITSRLKLEHRTVDIGTIRFLLAGSSLTSSEIEVPDGHYEEENMKSTVVPNRNMLLLSLAAAWAISLKADRIAYAAHSGDHAIYPDCREEFASAMTEAIRLADWHQVDLYRPFVNLSKQAIVKLGAKLGVPFGDTWSCYKGGQLHCGKCGTCIERREAFYLADVADPTEYAADAPELKDLVRNGWRLQS